jgi:enoyl-CoA hydratase/carnithine racemase
MAYANIRFENDGPLGILTLNRPNRRNALSLDMMLEVIQCLDRVGSDSAVRALILAAEGKVFSSGHDLSEMVDRNINDYRRIFDVCADMMMKIQAIPQR